MKKEYIKYISAEMPSFVRTVTNDKEFWPKEFYFWDPKECYEASGNFLVSLGLIPDDDDFLYDIKDAIKNNDIRMVDSGGFQSGRKGTSHLKPKWIIEKQELLGNCGHIFDKIPSNVSGLKDYPEKDFYTALNKTKRYVDIMQENRTKKDFKLYAVVHGKTLEKKQEWYDTLTKDHDFEGIAIRAEQLVQNIQFCLDNDIKENIHILGTRNLWILSLFATAAFRYKLKNVTVDSSYDRNHARITNFGEFSKRLQYGAPEFNLPFCNCSMCKALENKEEQFSYDIEDYDDFEEARYKLRNRYFLSHSHLETHKTVCYINAIANYSPDLYDFTTKMMVESKIPEYKQIFEAFDNKTTEEYIKNENAKKNNFIDKRQGRLI